MMKKKNIFLFYFYIIITIIILPTIIKLLSDFMVDLYWFDSQGFKSIFLKVIKVKIKTFFVFFSISFFLIHLNNFITRRNLGVKQEKLKKIFSGVNVDIKNIKIFSGFILVFIAFIFGIVTIGWWDKILKYVNAVNFNIKDPIFHNDIGFYVFKLNFLYLIKAWSFWFLLFLFMWAFMFYFATGEIVFSIRKIYIPKRIRAHLGFLLFLLFLNLSYHYILKQYGLLFNQHSIVKGPSYTDIHAYLLAYRILFISIAATGSLFIYWIFNNKFNLPLIAISVILILMLALIGVYPFFLQQFVVTPNEIEKEAPYIKNTIKYTRLGYKLNSVIEKEFDIKNNLTIKEIEKNREIINNIRLWDWRPLKNTFKQLQEIRPYYIFSDVDIDRYRIYNRLQQVMLSVREISHSNLPRAARNWINRYLKYTHGYGMVMIPVNKKNTEGMPEFFIKDIPPISISGLEIKRPEIYYGETVSDYVIVNSRTAEFDYPSGDGNVYSYYKGTGGIKFDSYLKKLLFAYYLPNIKILFSDLIQKNTRVMIHRNIIEAVKKVAPFLAIDNDPYAVLIKGKIYWIVDAYTYTDKFPYSEKYFNGLNYIRNSIKIIIDAYNGNMKFYIVDENEPIAGIYKKIYPSLFSDYSKLDKEFKAHFRYPSDMFLIQADMYKTYHMTKPDVFYNKEDYWDFPQEIYDTEEITMNNYYIVNKLKGESRSEFINMIPFTPAKKNNMISLLIGRCDEPNYGELIVYKFPKRYLVYGPMQIEARIDQNSEISKLISLWGQKGSKVIRGNLLVIPIGDSLIYVEPLFLQAEKQELPELKRIIVAYNNNISIAETLEDALTGAIMGNSDNVSEDKIYTDKEKKSIDSKILKKIKDASNLFFTAESYLKKGDFEQYGNYMKRLRKIFKEIQAMGTED